MRGSQRRFSLISLVIVVATLAFASPLQAQSQPPEAKPLTSAQLEQLVAPIALYPDDLLSQVLMASTYPLEVVEAARWSRDNPKVTGKALEDAMQKQAWDPSVKALTAVPQTLQMMNDQLKWTQDLGDAFLGQQEDVFTAVQSLRARADAAGNLQTTPQQTVRRVNRPANVSAPAGAPTTAYEIVPTVPNQYYVPIYDPAIVYGAWPYPAYPPLYWYPPGYVGAGLFGFTAAALTGAAIWGGVNWWNRNVNVNVNRYNQFNRTNISNSNWSHNAAHRGNVPYRDSNVSQKFGDQGKAKARESARQKVGEAGKGGKGGQKGAAGKKDGAGKAGGKAGQGGMAGGKTAQGGKAGAKQGGMAGAKQGGMAGAKQGGMAGAKTAQGGMAGGKTAQGGMAGAKAAQGGMAGGGMAGGGGMVGGGKAGGGRAGMGDGRRSDITVKHDVALLGTLSNGLGFYRFAYKGSDVAYVGVMAQEVQLVRPDAVVRGGDGYLRVFYDKLGLKFQSYEQWIASGARVPSARTH